MRLSTVLLTMTPLLGLTGTGCHAPRNPELVLPPAAPPVRRLEGTVVEAASAARPVANADLALVRLNGSPVADTFRGLAGPDGSFAFDSLQPGHYLLRVRFIGFRFRSDTIVIGKPPLLRLVIPREPSDSRIGHWPPRPAVRAAARAQRDRWVCDRERDSIEREREYWRDWFSTPSVRKELGLPAGRPVKPEEIRLVRDRALCRRAADALDRLEGVSGLATTLLRYAGFYLASQPTWDTKLVLDQHFELVQMLIMQ